MNKKEKKETEFIIKEPNFTEFEKSVAQVMWCAYNYDDFSDERRVDDESYVKSTANGLMSKAKKELIEQIKDKIKTTKKIKGYLPIENHDLYDAYMARGYQLACDDIVSIIENL